MGNILKLILFCVGVVALLRRAAGAVLASLPEAPLPSRRRAGSGPGAAASPNGGRHTAKTLDDLEHLLTSDGYQCHRVYDEYIRTQLPTNSYTNPAGRRSLAVHIAFDNKANCLTMDTPWAFDASRAIHKEAMLACLLVATGRSPLVKAHLDPDHGEVRLRIDCHVGAEGVREEEVLQMLPLLPAFADRWYPHIKDAMDKGGFDPAGTQVSPERERFESLARRCGGVNRIAALLRASTPDRKRTAEGDPPGQG